MMSRFLVNLINKHLTDFSGTEKSNKKYIYIRIYWNRPTVEIKKLGFVVCEKTLQLGLFVEKNVHILKPWQEGSIESNEKRK